MIFILSGGSLPPGHLSFLFLRQFFFLLSDYIFTAFFS
jgi:hypothetical protein